MCFHLQKVATGTLIASTIHTMSIFFKQMSPSDGKQLTAEHEVFPAGRGSLVVAGTCTLGKLPPAVERVSEPFPWADVSSTELLLGSSPVGVVRFPSWCPIGGLAVTSPGTSCPSSVVAAVLSMVEFSVWRPGSVDRTRLGSVEVTFWDGLESGVTGPSFGSTSNESVGVSFPGCVSRKVMVWCTCSAGDPTLCTLSFRPCADSRGFGAPLAADSAETFGKTVLEILGLLLVWLLLATGFWTWGTLTNVWMGGSWFTIPDLGSWSWVTWLSVPTVFGVMVCVSWMGLV